jgi:hypothetical protein
LLSSVPLHQDCCCLTFPLHPLLPFMLQVRGIYFGTVQYCSVL